ncbi:MAG: hypothetical protein QXI58_04470 [Candidatus Micrarchaeia archaeon]
MGSETIKIVVSIILATILLAMLLLALIFLSKASSLEGLRQLFGNLLKR